MSLREQMCFSNADVITNSAGNEKGSDEDRYCIVGAFSSAILSKRGTKVLSSTDRAGRNRSQQKIGAGLRSRVGPWRRRAATVIAGALALGMAYGVMFGHNGLTAFARKRQEEQTLSVQMQQLQRDNARLQGHVERLQNDPSAIEHQAREELHYTRAGEVIYTLPAAVSSKTESVPNE